MLRAALLGILVAASLGACGKSKNDAPSVAVGTAAGKVIELSGKATAVREGKSRELAQGAEVFRDDQIETAADSTLTIELFHNGAHWSVIANKKARVDSSLAWGLDKQAASKTVEHNSAAAGRNAERSAAETGATTGEEPARAEAAPAPASAGASAAPPPAPMAEAVGRGAPGGGAPPPPPPPMKTRNADKDEKEVTDDGAAAPRPRAATKASAKDAAPDVTGDSAPHTPTPPQAPMSDPAPESMKVVISPQELANHHKDEFKACLDAKHPKVTLTITITKGKPAITLAGEKSTKVKNCATAVAKKIDWMPGVSSKVVLKFE